MKEFWVYNQDKTAMVNIAQLRKILRFPTFKGIFTDEWVVLGKLTFLDWFTFGKFNSLVAAQEFMQNIAERSVTE